MALNLLDLLLHFLLSCDFVDLVECEELDDDTSKEDHSRTAKKDQCDCYEIKKCRIDWFNFFIADRVKCHDDHVKCIAQVPALRHVRERRHSRYEENENEAAD